MADRRSRSGHASAGAPSAGREHLRPQTGDIAVIAYIPGALAAFLRELTARLAPAVPRTHPHLTLLPPQPPSLPLAAMVAHLGATVATDPAFPIRVGDIATFLPISEVLYLELTRGETPARQLHQKLIRTYRGGEPERFRYHPHITLAYALEPGEVARLLPAFQQEWMAYRGPREATLDTLTLVQLTSPLMWEDVGTAPLRR